jgi:hypothetical protein
LKHDESSISHRACAALDSRSLTTALSVRKKTKGPRAATRLAAPWRQGTETGSAFIVFPTISTVNSQRQLGQQRKDK